MRQHAHKRLFERYGLAITNAEYEALCLKCADGRAPVLAPGHKGSTIHRLEVRGVAVNAVWRPDVGAIASFMPKGDRTQFTRTKVKDKAGLAQLVAAPIS
jgi:hypothetical protein